MNPLGLYISIAIGYGISPSLPPLIEDGQQIPDIYQHQTLFIAQAGYRITKRTSVELMHLSRPTKIDPNGGINAAMIRIRLK